MRLNDDNDDNDERQFLVKFVSMPAVGVVFVVLTLDSEGACMCSVKWSVRISQLRRPKTMSQSH